MQYKVLIFPKFLSFFSDTYLYKTEKASERQADGTKRQLLRLPGRGVKDAIREKQPHDAAAADSGGIGLRRTLPRPA